MPGIEFVGADDVDADDDVLDNGLRRPWPRWVWVLAGVLAAAVVVAAIVSSATDKAPHTATPTPAPTSIAASTAGPPAAQISALASDGSSLYWLAGSRLYRAGSDGRALDSAAVSADDFTETQLVPDPDERTVWLVSRGSIDAVGGGDTVEGFDRNLTLGASVTAPALIDGAAAFNGALYVLSGGRLLRTTARGGAFVTVADVGQNARGLVASDDGLLFVEGSHGNVLGRWTPGGGVSPARALDTTDSSLAVVGNTVFVVGTKRGRDVFGTLTEFGPRMVRHPIPTGLSGALQVVATGTRSVIVFGIKTSGFELACFGTGRLSDAASFSRISSAPAVSANVAIVRTVVFQAAGSGVRPALFDRAGCAG